MSKSEKYLFIVKTDSYAGNFEREMCAYMTGILGDCEVGANQATQFVEEEPVELINAFESYIAQVQDDEGCYRPVELWNDSNSFIIYFYKQPTEKMIEVMMRRAKEYGNYHHRYGKINVLGFSLKSQEVMTVYKDIKDFQVVNSMKLICDCGNEMTFIKTGETDQHNSEWARLDHSKFTITAEHDICWITCNKCNNNSIVFHT